MSTVEAPKLKFESFLPSSRGVGYVCPNEDVTIWRELVKGKRIRRAAGICSGGEVGFFALLPTVRDELVLIDHNCASLYYAMSKYLLLRQWGYAGMIRLMRHPAELKRELEALNDHLPQIVRDARDDLYYRGKCYERLVKAASNTDTYVGTGSTQILSQWLRVKLREQKAVDTKLDKITFIHGDFDALDNQGKFDLLYMSNAHDGGNGNTGKKDLERVTKCLNPGAFVLSSTTIRSSKEPKEVPSWDYYTRTYVTRENPRYQVQPDSWKLVESIPRRSIGMDRWSYNLYQVQS